MLLLPTLRFFNYWAASWRGICQSSGFHTIRKAQCMMVGNIKGGSNLVEKHAWKCQRLPTSATYILYSHAKRRSFFCPPSFPFFSCQRPPPNNRVGETFELNQLKSAPSQLLPVFSEFDRLPTCCHSVGPVNILYFFPSAG